jgi:hypothetical protein
MTKPRDLATLGGGFTQSGTGAIQRTVENKLKDTVSVKDFGAVGDGVADDYAALQTAITYAFNNKIGTVYLPKGTYNISKPLYVWGSDNYIRSGVQLVGSGIDSTVIKKTNNATLGDGSWNAAIDAVIILSPYPANTTGAQLPSATYNPALIDMSIQGYSTTPNTYGIYTKDDFGQVKMERLCVQTVNTCFRTDAGMWLSSFRNISFHPVINGFWMNSTGTSIDLTNVYVLGGSGVGFNLQSLYSTANSIAVEGSTGTPVILRFANWTINGLGVECAAATGPAVQVLNGSNIVLNNPLILSPNAFLCGDGCKMMVNGAQLGDEFAPAARTGYLWFVAGGGDLSIINLINYDTFATANTGFAMVTDFSGTAPLSPTQLKIDTPYATTSLEIKGGSNSNASNAVIVNNSSGTQLFQVRNDGVFWTGLAAASPYNNTSGAAANIGVDASGILFRSTSSLKYKENVQDSVHGLAEVMQLRPVTYQGKAENDANKVFGGLIAEEVHALGLAEFVQYAEDGTPDALAYGNMVSLLVKAIQQLKTEFDAYKESN